MARARKNAAKGQGDLLTSAGVDINAIPEIPAEEQPYPLPDGWKWVRLGAVLSTSKAKTEDFSSQNIKYIGLEHIEKDKGIIGIGTSAGIRSLKNIFEPGQILYGKLRPYLNKHDIVDFSGICSTDILVFNCNDLSINKYVNYYFNIQYFREHVINNSNGINLPRVSEKVILNASFPLPPLDEQQLIVANIESLFSKLDAAREKAQAVYDSVEARKAAILHKAFSGELTEKWRKEQAISITSWETKNLGSLAVLQTGIMKGKKFSGPTILKPYLRVANVQDGYFDLSEIKQIEVEKTQAKRWLLQREDVLFTEGGDFDKLGRGAVWEENIVDCLHQNHIFAVRVNKNILNPYFLSYQSRSKYGREYFLSCSKQTTNLASINSTQLKNFPVRLPSLSEQQEIVRILDELFAKEQKIKEAAEHVLEQIDLIKKAILAKAFRGELSKQVRN